MLNDISIIVQYGLDKIGFSKTLSKFGHFKINVRWLIHTAILSRQTLAPKLSIYFRFDIFREKDMPSMNDEKFLSYKTIFLVVAAALQNSSHLYRDQSFHGEPRDSKSGREEV